MRRRIGGHTVTRWCCSSAMCLDCRGIVNGRGRKRVIQAHGLSKDMADKYVHGWARFGPKVFGPGQTTDQGRREKR